MCFRFQVGIGEVGLDFQPYLTPTEAHKDEQRHVVRSSLMCSFFLTMDLFAYY